MTQRTEQTGSGVPCNGLLVGNFCRQVAEVNLLIGGNQVPCFLKPGHDLLGIEAGQICRDRPAVNGLFCTRTLHRCGRLHARCTGGQAQCREQYACCNGHTHAAGAGYDSAAALVRVRDMAASTAQR